MEEVKFLFYAAAGLAGLVSLITALKERSNPIHFFASITLLSLSVFCLLGGPLS